MLLSDCLVLLLFGAIALVVLEIGKSGCAVLVIRRSHEVFVGYCAVRKCLGQARMCAELRVKESIFPPFNNGHSDGTGNPPIRWPRARSGSWMVKGRHSKGPGITPASGFRYLVPNACSRSPARTSTSWSASAIDARLTPSPPSAVREIRRKVSVAKTHTSPASLRQ